MDSAVEIHIKRCKNLKFSRLSNNNRKLTVETTKKVVFETYENLEEINIIGEEKETEKNSLDFNGFLDSKNLKIKIKNMKVTTIPGNSKMSSLTISHSKIMSSDQRLFSGNPSIENLKMHDNVIENVFDLGLTNIKSDVVFKNNKIESYCRKNEDLSRKCFYGNKGTYEANEIFCQCQSCEHESGSILIFSLDQFLVTYIII